MAALKLLGIDTSNNFHLKLNATAVIIYLLRISYASYITLILKVKKI